MISDDRLKLIAEGDHVQCGDASAMAKELLELRKGREIPEGWKLVPVEITQEMVDANFEGVCIGGVQAGYRAMLAAAPEVA